MGATGAGGGGGGGGMVIDGTSAVEGAGGVVHDGSSAAGGASLEGAVATVTSAVGLGSPAIEPGISTRKYGLISNLTSSRR